MQTIIRCRNGSCSPGKNLVVAGAMKSSTSIRNAQEKIQHLHVRIVKKNCAILASETAAYISAPTSIRETVCVIFA